MLVTSRFENSRYNISNRLFTYIINFKDDLAKLTTLYRSILIVVDEPSIADLQRRCIGEALSDLLYARMLRHTGLWLLGTVVTGVITRLEIIDTVIMTVAAIEATTIIRRINHRFLITWCFAILTTITGYDGLTIAVLIRSSVTLN